MRPASLSGVQGKTCTPLDAMHAFGVGDSPTCPCAETPPHVVSLRLCACGHRAHKCASRSRSDPCFAVIVTIHSLGMFSTRFWNVDELIRPQEHLSDQTVMSGEEAWCAADIPVQSKRCVEGAGRLRSGALCRPQGLHGPWFIHGAPSCWNKVGPSCSFFTQPDLCLSTYCIPIHLGLFPQNSATSPQSPTSST